MKYVVIAHHHGAFLTIKQLRELKQEFVVLVPQTQVEKYSTMGEDIFKNYLPNLKKAAGKGTPVFTADMRGNFLNLIATWMAELQCTGQWTVMQAGSLLLSTDNDVSIKTQFGLVSDRVHPKFKKLYTMLGEPEKSDKMYMHTIFVNMDKRDGKVTEVPSDAVMRPDILYKMSFGPLWCLRHRQMVKHSAVANFWMESIRAEQEIGEWIAYPYHLYGEYAKKVKAMIPPVSFENIMANAESAAWMQELVELDL
jgi:hypothetical protein